jgi:tRNA (mo5U34)-methyltransferase
MLHFRPPNWHPYHTFELPGGRVIKGIEDNACTFNVMKPLLPDIQGKTVIDIGAWDGYYSFKMEQMGASRVLATDHFCWSGAGWGNKDVFDVMHHVLGSFVEDIDIDPSEIRPATVGMFDVVLFLSVLYHRTDCFQTFINAASVCKEWLVVRTLLDDNISNETPLLSFHPFDDVNSDPTNWFIPNCAAVEAMFSVCGFSIPRTSIGQTNMGYSSGTFVAKRIAASLV